MNKRHVTAQRIFGTCFVARPFCGSETIVGSNNVIFIIRFLRWLLFVILSWLLFHHDVNAIVVWDVFCCCIIWYMSYISGISNMIGFFTKVIRVMNSWQVWDIFSKLIQNIQLLNKFDCEVLCNMIASELLLSKEQNIIFYLRCLL